MAAAAERKEEEVDGRRVDRVQFSRGFEVHRQKSSHFHFKNWRHTESACVPSRLTPSRRGGDSGPSPSTCLGVGTAAPEAKETTSARTISNREDKKTWRIKEERPFRKISPEQRAGSLGKKSESHTPPSPPLPFPSFSKA